MASRARPALGALRELRKTAGGLLAPMLAHMVADATIAGIVATIMLFGA